MTIFLFQQKKIKPKRSNKGWNSKATSIHLRINKNK